MLALPAYADDDKQFKEIELTATPVECNEANPEQKINGKLKCLSVFQLTSVDDDFGGISGLGHTYSHKMRHILPFITDNGYQGKIALDSNHHIKSNSLFLFKLIGLPKDIDLKKAGDAEAISQGQEHIFIAFEQQHRIIAYHGGPLFKSLPLPANIDVLQANGGLETMEALSDGRLLLMAEHPTRKTGQHFGWIGTAPKDDPLAFTYETRLIAPPKGYSPTDATELPNGDVLVLLRRFTPIDGISAKFWRIKKSMLDESGPITGEVIATLAPPLTVDNMEGIAVIDVSKDGNPIIAVISDDNFNSFQRTLLLIFEVMK